MGSTSIWLHSSESPQPSGGDVLGCSQPTIVGGVTLPVRLRGDTLAPKHWALAAVLVPLSGGICRLVVIALTQTGVVASQWTQAAVAIGTSAVVAALLAPLRNPWARTVSLAFAIGFVIGLLEVAERLWLR